jgi:hypothetical protein
MPLPIHVPILDAEHLALPITFRFILRSDRDAEAVERRVHQERWILEPAPVDCASERTQRAVHSRDRTPLAVRRLEALDRLHFLEHSDRFSTEDRLYRFEPSLDRDRIA